VYWLQPPPLPSVTARVPRTSVLSYEAVAALRMKGLNPHPANNCGRPKFGWQRPLRRN